MTTTRTPYKGGSPTVFALFNESTRRGWSYKMIADKVGIGPSTVKSWWSGDRAPGIDNVEKWARALNGFLVFSLPAEIAARRDDVAHHRADKGAFRPQMDEWSREARQKKLVPYAGREDL